MGRCNRRPADMQTLPDCTGRSVDRGGHNHDRVQEGEKEEQETDDPEILCIKYACVACSDREHDRPRTHVRYDQPDDGGRNCE